MQQEHSIQPEKYELDGRFLVVAHALHVHTT
jgi:hypothetical protein